MYKQADVEEPLEQARWFREFWPIVAQLPQSHPFAVRRVWVLYDLGFFEASTENPASEGAVSTEFQPQ